MTAAPLSVADVAARLGRSPDVVRRLIRRGHLPARCLPGGHASYLILPEDFQAFLDATLVTPPPKPVRGGRRRDPYERLI